VLHFSLERAQQPATATKFDIEFYQDGWDAMLKALAG
jgi:hypothetical protein